MMASSPPSHAARLPRKSRTSHALTNVSQLQTSDSLRHASQQATSTQSARTSLANVFQKRARRRDSSSELSDGNDAASDAYKPPAATKSSRNSSARPRERKHWTHQEDKILIKAYDRWAGQPEKIAKALERAGIEVRGTETFRNRYRIIKDAAARQQAIAAHTVSNSSSSTRQQQQPQEPSNSIAALIAASATLVGRTGSQASQPWTQKELTKLAAIGRLGLSISQMYEAFTQAFPTTTRSVSSITLKWQRLRFGEEYGSGPGTTMKWGKKALDHIEIEDDEGATEEYDGVENGGEEEDEDEESEAKYAGVTGLRSRMHHDHQYPSAAATGFKAASGAPTTTTSCASPSSVLLDVSITRQDYGFRVEAVPPGYGDPDQCQLVGPSWWHEHEEEAAAAAFAFKVGQDGAVEALRVPKGTTMSTTIVRAEDCRGMGERGVERGICGWLAQTSFTAPDDFRVVFMREAIQD